MHIGYRTDDHPPRKTEEAGGYDTMRNVRGKNPGSIWPDYRNLERHESIRDGVEVTAAPAPSVREAHIGALAETIVRGDVGLSIVGNSGVFQSQQSRASSGAEYLIEEEQAHRAALKVASPQVQVFAHLVFNHGVPGK